MRVSSITVNLAANLFRKKLMRRKFCSGLFILTLVFVWILHTLTHLPSSKNLQQSEIHILILQAFIYRGRSTITGTSSRYSSIYYQNLIHLRKKVPLLVANNLSPINDWVSSKNVEVWTAIAPPTIQTRKCLNNFSSLQYCEKTAIVWNSECENLKLKMFKISFVQTYSQNF